MKSYKKSLFGSLLAFFLGTSCCWLSSAVIWLGGLSFAGILVNFMADIQVLMISLGIILLLTTLFLYLKRKGKISKR